MKKVAFAGNPNVGKSTLFNAITHLKQHTGNWPGKTVEVASARIQIHKEEFEFIDLPGTYSLSACSEEERVAAQYLCFHQPDLVVLVCDGCSFERNLYLVLEVLQICRKCICCINLYDECIKNNIQIDLNKLKEELKIPVIFTSARNKQGIDELLELIAKTDEMQENLILPYPKKLEIPCLQLNELLKQTDVRLSHPWFASRLLVDTDGTLEGFEKELKINTDTLKRTVNSIKEQLAHDYIDEKEIQASFLKQIQDKAARICEQCVTQSKTPKTYRFDTVLTHPVWGILIMLGFLLMILYLTLKFSNLPSSWLFKILFEFEGTLRSFLISIHTSPYLVRLFTEGIYRTCAWVVSVMLPPMAIFFPLFTYLEELGFLPRLSFNVDKCFKKCGSCGKQALTMCMSLGCNAVGVLGSRIFDSPYERNMAAITASLIPCNGRFPLLISLCTMFFLSGAFSNSFSQAFLLLCCLLLSFFITLMACKILSKMIYKKASSTFALELPGYRLPKLSKVLSRSLIDRTWQVLKRAVAVSLIAGGILYLCANIPFQNTTLLWAFADFLDPLAGFFGVNGVIFCALIFAFPANEIIMPIILMLYLSNSSLIEIDNLVQIKEILTANGWTFLTAFNTLILTMFHWPCSSTLLTVYHETKSKTTTFLAFIIPTLIGLILCLITTQIFKLL